MPPKRRNNAASTSRAQKRAKLEEEDSDESYHSSGDTDAGSDADSDAGSSYSEPPQTTRGKRGKPEPAKRVVKSRATKAIASPTEAITSSTKATGSSTASVRDGRVAVTLEVLLEQPLDIVLEIFSYLTPFDLLRLTRTSKTVRKAFLNPASKPCWNVTWMNSKGLPPCPEDMAIPAFVSLMYEAQCFRCRKTNQVELCMVSRARFCKDCHDWLYRYQKFTWDEIESGFRTDPYMLNTVVPVISGYNPDEWADEGEAGEEDQDDQDDGFVYVEDDRWGQTFKNARYRGQLEFCVRFEDITEFKYAWRRCPVAERIQFLKDRQAEIKARKKHAVLCYKWLHQRSKDVEDQQAIAQTARYEKIVAELRENGWGSVLDDMTADEMEDFRKLSDVRKTQKLNKRSLKAMLPRLEPFLQKCKRSHARSAR